MDAKINNVIYMELNSGPKIANSTCGKTIDVEKIDRDSTVYINDLPKAVEHKALTVLFADDTGILVASPNNIQMQRDLNEIFMQLNKWFKSNFLSLNFDKPSFIHFTNKST